MIVVLLLFLSVQPAWFAEPNYEAKLKSYLDTVPKALSDEALMTVPELVSKNGYPLETHTATTEDGYILTLHRIPYGKEFSPKKRPVAFLQHGIICSSADWVVTGPTNGLAYILADRGYDVWMGNARGNRYSRNHTKFDPDEDAKDFWDFSWHEIGVYDLPSMIDYILEATTQESIFYVGHSQGTTAFYVMTSEKPEYNSKIRVMISLAPIAFMGHVTSPLVKLIAHFGKAIEYLLGATGVNEFLPSSEFTAYVGDILCSDDSITQLLCSNTLFAICGFDAEQLNVTMLPVIMGHTPAGTSIKQFYHYAQEIRSGKFQKYDYGFFKNIEMYNSISPPDYDLKSITAPVYLIYSHNDWLAHVTDVSTLYQSLGNPRGRFILANEKFNHVDYMFANDAPSLVYNKVISLMRKHEM